MQDLCLRGDSLQTTSAGRRGKFFGDVNRVGGKKPKAHSPSTASEAAFEVFVLERLGLREGGKGPFLEYSHPHGKL